MYVWDVFIYLFYWICVFQQWQCWRLFTYSTAAISFLESLASVQLAFKAEEASQMTVEMNLKNKSSCFQLKLFRLP